jgi:hypothetical protein
MMRKIAGGAIGLVGLNLFLATFLIGDAQGDHAGIGLCLALTNMLFAGCALIALGFWLGVVSE